MGSEPLRTAREVISRLTATTQSQSHGKKNEMTAQFTHISTWYFRESCGWQQYCTFSDGRMMERMWAAESRDRMPALGLMQRRRRMRESRWMKCFFSPSTNSATGVFFKCRLLTTPAGQLQCEASRLPQLGKINDYAECMECWIRWSFCYAMFINSGINAVWELCSG